MIDNDQDIIKSINIYLENVNNSLVLVEVNEPIRQIEIIESIKNEIKDKNILEVDLLNTKLNHLEKVQECIKNDTKNSEIVLVTNLHQISNKIENNITDSELVRDLNFSREPYAKLKKVIVFFLPVYFVDLVIRNAPDFYDFLSVKFRFKSEDKIPSELKNIEINDDVDERYVKNRINFLESILEDYGDIDANYIKHLIDLSNNYELLGYYNKSKSKLIDALNIIDETYNSDLKIQLLLTISTLEYSLKNYVKSIEYYQNAYNLYIKYELDDKNLLSQIFGLFGRTYLKIGDYNNAIQFINKSIDLNRELKNKGFLIFSLSDLKDLYLKKNKHQLAFDLSEELLNLSYEYNIKINIKLLFDFSNIKINLTNINEGIKFIEGYLNRYQTVLPKYRSQIKLYLSRLYFEIKDFENSSSLIDEALKISDILDIKVYSFYIKALINKEKGNYDSSIKYLNEILELTKNGEKRFLLHKYLSYYQLGEIYFNLNQIDKALEYLWESFEKLKDSEFYESFNILNTISKSYNKQNRENKYIDSVKLAINYSNKKDKNYYIKAIFAISKFYFDRNKFSSSINYLQKGLKVFDELESSEYKIKILDLLIKNYTNLNDKKNILKYREKLNLLIKK